MPLCHVMSGGYVRDGVARVTKQACPPQCDERALCPWPRPLPLRPPPPQGEGGGASEEIPPIRSQDGRHAEAL